MRTSRVRIRTMITTWLVNCLLEFRKWAPLAVVIIIDERCPTYLRIRRAKWIQHFAWKQTIWRLSIRTTQRHCTAPPEALVSVAIILSITIECACTKIFRTNQRGRQVSHSRIVEFPSWTGCRLRHRHHCICHHQFPPNDQWHYLLNMPVAQNYGPASRNTTLVDVDRQPVHAVVTVARAVVALARRQNQRHQTVWPVMIALIWVPKTVSRHYHRHRAVFALVRKRYSISRFRARIWTRQFQFRRFAGSHEGTWVSAVVLALAVAALVTVEQRHPSITEICIGKAVGPGQHSILIIEMGRKNAQP